MRLRDISILFLIVLVTLLQGTALNTFGPFKVKPDIFLILVFFFSLRYGRNYGLYVGIICGIFGEATSGVPAGALVFIYALAGLALGHLGNWIYSQRLLGEVAIPFISSLMVYSFLFFVFLTQGSNLSPLKIFYSLILPVCCYTAISAPFIFCFLRSVFKPS